MNLNSEVVKDAGLQVLMLLSTFTSSHNSVPYNSVLHSLVISGKGPALAVLWLQ